MPQKYKRVFKKEYPQIETVLQQINTQFFRKEEILNLILTQELHEKFTYHEIYQRIYDGVYAFITSLNLSITEPTDAVLHYDITYMTQHIQLNRKEGYIGATQKSLEEFRDGLIFEEQLIPLKNITGYSITFIKGGYPSFPILFYFHTSQNLTEKDSELAQILTEVLQNFNINIKYYITDRDQGQQAKIFEKQIDPMIKKIIGTKDGLKFSRLYRTPKKPLYINCSIHLCKNIRARNLNGRTELSHFDNDKYVTNINLEKIFKNNKDLFPTDLRSNSPLYKQSDALAVLHIEPTAVLSLYESIPQYGYYTVILMPFIAQYLVQNRQQFWNSCYISLNILVQMIRNIDKAKEKDQEGIILSKDKVAVTSKYTLEEFAQLTSKERKQYMVKLTFTIDQIKSMINILVIAIHLVENNEQLYLAVLNNNNIERTFGLIKNITSTTDNHQYMYKAVQDLLLYKYLKFLESDFKFKNNFRESYCNTLTGNLDNSTKQYDKIKHLARCIYQHQTGKFCTNAYVGSYEYCLKLAFEYTGFDKCQLIRNAKGIYTYYKEYNSSKSLQQSRIATIINAGINERKKIQTKEQKKK